jgi:hypothetical protein
MPKEIQIEIAVAIDEHGNYIALGGNAFDTTKSKAFLLDEIYTTEYNSIATSFKVNIQLPDPKDHEKEENDQVNNVS